MQLYRKRQKTRGSMHSQNVTDLRQMEWIKQRLEIALDALEDRSQSSEYDDLKALIVEKTGGLELEDVIMDANRFSKGVDDLEMQAQGEEETEEEETDGDQDI